jgi:hypothetical protein
MKEAAAAPTGSTSSISDRSDDLRRALAELEPGEPGAGEGSASATRSSADPAEEPAPVPLTPDELVNVTETIVGLGVGIFALFTGKEMPDEARLRMSDGTRKLLGICAPATIEAAGEHLQENAELLRSVAPLGFCLGTLGHGWQKIQEVRKSKPSSDKPAEPTKPTSAAPSEPPPGPKVADAPTLDLVPHGPRVFGT